MSFKSLSFDGTSSMNYGVYITGEAVYNAPEREVEMLNIPARNGAFALDKGRYENIEVTYPAGIYADDETDFAQAISDFRNFLCSKKGYCRLEDEYNSGEYREAVYKNGLEVTPTMLRAGEFEITFECKPQRFLTSGESAIGITSGDTITNPTLYEAKPLLQVWGYGGFEINGEELEIVNQTIGDIQVYSGNSGNHTFDTTYANNNDRIYGEGYLFVGSISIKTALANVTSASITSVANWNSTAYYLPNGIFADVKYTGDFSYGTAKTDTAVFTISATIGGTARTITYTANAIYDGANRIKITTTVGALPAGCTLNSDIVYGGNTWLNSSTSTLGAPLYFDLDIGEAYIINGGSIASVNNTVTIPPELPALNSGANTITYDNTITQFKIVPRWWQL